jgi:hypothetical protein
MADRKIDKLPVESDLYSHLRLNGKRVGDATRENLLAAAAREQALSEAVRKRAERLRNSASK